MKNTSQQTHIICEKCGKGYSSKGIKTHEMYCKGIDTHKPRLSEVSDTHEDTYETRVSKGMKQGYEKTDKLVDEVNFMEESSKSKAEIQPKKTEDEYQCGNCNATFTKRVKFCPECGVGFE